MNAATLLAKRSPRILVPLLAFCWGWISVAAAQDDPDSAKSTGETPPALRGNADARAPRPGVPVELRKEVDALVDALSSPFQEVRDRAQDRLIEIGNHKKDGVAGEQRCRMVVRALGRISSRGVDAWVRRRAIVQAIDGREFDEDMRRAMVVDLFHRLETKTLVIWSAHVDDMDQRREPRSNNDDQYLTQLHAFGAQGLDLLERTAPKRGLRFRINAAHLMGQLDPDRAARLFFSDENADVRVVAVCAYSREASGSSDLAAAFEPVAKLAKDPAQVVRWMVVRASRYYHREIPDLPKVLLPPKTMPMLLRMLRDPARVVRSAAASLLEEITRADVMFNPFQTQARREAQAKAWDAWWNAHRNKNDLRLYPPLKARPNRGWSAPDAYRLRLGGRKR